MPPKRPNGKKVPVSSLKHKDKRTNIPTRELQDFVKDEEKSPKTVQYPGLLYARDPSLDPQLVWKGKDEQDQKPLEVPAVPVYIQEKIHPQAIVEQVKAEAKKTAPAMASLFADFNGLSDFDKLVDFYKWPLNWSNRMILGDSLLVMTSLAEKEGLKGKVQMVYIDPPYGIRFGSNWQVSTRKREVKDGRPEDATRQPEQVRAFRDTWQLGVHSYLTYLRDRLVAARELLSETGSVFVQIGDENVHLVRSVMDEVFGSENFVSQIAFRKTSNLTALYLPTSTDFILWFAKDSTRLKFRNALEEKTYTSVSTDSFGCVEFPDFSWRRLKHEEKEKPASLPEDWRLFGLGDLTSSHYYDSPPFEFQGKVYTSKDRFWSTSPTGLRRLSLTGRVASVGETLRMRRYFDDFRVVQLNNLWDDTGTGSQTEDRVFVVQTATKVIERCLLMTTDPGDLVLDPTCGSGTTAYVAEEWGRRWITMDTSRVALALARTRLMAAKFPYYQLSDTREGYNKEQELSATPVPAGDRRFGTDIRKGFVYKRVPHVTLKSIANNEDIDTIHAKWQERLEPLRMEFNKATRQAWEEWQIPREADSKWSDKAKQAHKEWWKLRRERQQEIDASIAKHADTELLYDQPYEDNKRIRVSGPFTVESLSPHRTLGVSEKGDGPARGLGTRSELSDNSVMSPSDTSQFVNLILENLK